MRQYEAATRRREAPRNLPADLLANGTRDIGGALNVILAADTPAKRAQLPPSPLCRQPEVAIRSRKRMVPTRGPGAKAQCSVA
jgi:hypothetical protein